MDIDDLCKWIFLYCVFKYGYVVMVNFFIKFGLDCNKIIIKLKLVVLCVFKRNYKNVF